jgi:hypothetical protein
MADECKNETARNVDRAAYFAAYYLAHKERKRTQCVHAMRRYRRRHRFARKLSECLDIGMAEARRLAQMVSEKRGQLCP